MTVWRGSSGGDVSSSVEMLCMAMHHTAMHQKGMRHMMAESTGESCIVGAAGA